MTKFTLICFLYFVFLSSGPAQAVTLTFDFSHPDGVAAGKGSGLLHSISADDPPDCFVYPLRLNFWRGAKILDDGLYLRLRRS